MALGSRMWRIFGSIKRSACARAPANCCGRAAVRVRQPSREMRSKEARASCSEPTTSLGALAMLDRRNMSLRFSGWICPQLSLPSKRCHSAS